MCEFWLKNEKYADQHFHDRQALKEARKKNITEKPFRFTSPPKKSTGLGDYFGSIGKVFEHMQEYEVKKLVKGEVKPGDKKNIVTNPSKKGTYGFAHIGIGKDFEFKGDPFNAPHEKELEDKKKMNAKIVGKGPFKSMSKTLDFFDTQPNVAASRIYTLDKPIPERADKTSKSPPKTAEKPFKPSSPPKNGFNSTFSKFPEYIGNPYDIKLTPEEAKAAKEKRASKESSKPVWKAVSTIRSSPCRSVIFGSYRGGSGGVNATM